MMSAEPVSAIESALAAAQAGGLEPNVDRWLRFAGLRRYHELQALNIRFGNAVRTYFAHAPVNHLAGLIARAEKEYDCAGIYVIANPIKPAVATRGELSKWRAAQKGESTTDRDIAARTVMVIDVDAVRPTGTSATDAEVAATAIVASKVYEALAAILEGDTALAYGHSGNGRMVLVALDAITNDDVTLHTVKAILLALHSLYSNDEAQVDPAVCDAKRLIPAWGSMKKKGATGIAERPHRRTALICAEMVTRIGTPELRRVLATLRDSCDTKARALIDKELGVKAERPATSAETPFTRANLVDVADVVAWLGLDEGDAVRCPGCGECDGTSVVLINNGLKCSHARCSLKGKPGGFRTPVDLVVEAHNVSPKEAVEELAERFGFEGFPDRKVDSDEPPEGRFDDEDSKASPPDSHPAPKVWTAKEIVDRWFVDGPLVHMPTMFPTIDNRTGGGPVAGCSVYLLGAPNAWKTAIQAQLADVYERQGCAVGFLSVDEEPDDLVTRFLQRRMWLRRDCETRDPSHQQRMVRDADAMTLRIYDNEHTIESAAADLHAAAGDRRAVLFIDSIQTVRSALVDPKASPREAVTAVTKAIRAVRSSYKMLVFATSEMSRAAYRSVESAEQTNDMAAGKESGAIEYAARLMLSFRSVKDQPGMIEVRIPKNKLGIEGEPFYLRGEHSHMTIVECDGPDQPEEVRVDELAEAAKAIVAVLVRHPGVGTNALRAKLAASGVSMGVPKLSAALEYAVMNDLVEDRPNQRGKVTDHHYYAVPKGS